MIFIPTWVDNLALIAVFIVVSLQYRVADPPRRIRNGRFGVLVACGVLMTLAAFYNEPGSWASPALFLGTLLCAAAAWHFQRIMPIRRAEH